MEKQIRTLVVPECFFWSTWRRKVALLWLTVADTTYRSIDTPVMVIGSISTQRMAFSNLASTTLVTTDVHLRALGPAASGVLPVVIILVVFYSMTLHLGCQI